MAFLGALAGLSAVGAAAQEISQEQKVSSDALYKQMMLQLRSLQMGNALAKQQGATGVSSEVGAAIQGLGNPEDTGIVPPAPPDPTTTPAGPGAALGAPPPGMPPAGPQAGAGAPSGQPAPGQQAAQAPPQGPPQGQVAQMGNVQQPGQVQPTQPPRPDGGPTFPQPLAQQGVVQVPQMQAQQQPGRGAAYASLQDPTQVPTPGQERAKARQGVIAQAGVPETGKPQQPQQVAQAGQPQQQPQQRRQPQQVKTSEDLMNYVRTFRNPQTGQPLSPKAKEEFIKRMLPVVRDMETRAQQKETAARQNKLLGFAEGREKRAQEKEERERRISHSEARGVIEGRRAPDMSGLWHNRAEAEAEILDTGFDLKKAQMDYKRQTIVMKNMLAPRMLQFRTFAGTAQGEIQRVLDLSDKLQLSGFTDWNKVRLEAYARGAGNTEEGKLVRSYLTATSELKSNLATLASGAYAPTESAWQRAKEQVDSNWGVGAMHSALQESQRFLNYRLQAMDDIINERFGLPGEKSKRQEITDEPQREGPQIPDTAVKALQDGKPHRFHTPDGVQIWQLKDGKPERVE